MLIECCSIALGCKCHDIPILQLTMNCDLVSKLVCHSKESIRRNCNKVPAAHIAAVMWRWCHIRSLSSRSNLRENFSKNGRGCCPDDCNINLLPSMTVGVGGIEMREVFDILGQTVCMGRFGKWRVCSAALSNSVLNVMRRGPVTFALPSMVLVIHAL